MHKQPNRTASSLNAPEWKRGSSTWLARNNLGTAFLQQGRTNEAIKQYQEALRLKPDFAQARDNLARAFGMTNAPASK